MPAPYKTFKTKLFYRFLGDFSVLVQNNIIIGARWRGVTEKCNYANHSDLLCYIARLKCAAAFLMKVTQALIP